MKILLVTAAVFLMLFAACYADAADTLRSDFTDSGVVRDIDTRSKEFSLEADNATYRISAQDSVVRVQGGRSGDFRDIAGGDFVRVYGKRISARGIEAEEIVVLDERKSYKPQPLRSGPIEFEGVVVRAEPAYREFTVDDGRDRYFVETRPDTVIRRYIYVADVRDIAEGDTVSIHGTVTGQRVTAKRISIVQRGSYRSGRDNGDRYYGRRETVLEGEVVGTASWFDRSLAVRTPDGDITVEVPRSTSVIRDGKNISVHDLRKGDYVRAYGVLEGRTLSATRMEVIDFVYPMASRSDDKIPPGDNSEISDTADTRAPDESPVAVSPREPDSYTGRIVAIDVESALLTVDIELQDVTVDASEVVITRNDSLRRLSDLKPGDKISIKGKMKADALHAAEIAILD